MQSSYHFRLFGVFRGTINGKPLPHFRSNKVRALLAYLLIEGQRPLLRTHLIDLLWHGYTPDSGRASLRVALSDLRQVPELSEIIESNSESVMIHPHNVMLWCDALEAERQVMSSSINEVLPTALHKMLYNGMGELIFLAGMETIDSEPFLLWLAERRCFYHQLQGNLHYQYALAA